MNTLGKAALLTTLMSLSITAAAGPNGGLADRVNEARSHPDKTVHTDTRARQIHREMIETMKEAHSGEGNTMTQANCLQMMREHMDGD